MIMQTNLYAPLNKVEDQDDGTIRVYGIASTESVDAHGEVVKADAIRDAMADYLRYPALREMHKTIAAGSTIELVVGDDDVTRIVGHVVDPTAILKVKSGVYRGFSIGGKVTKRDPKNPKTITGISLAEISLVDRPSQGEAELTMWKADYAGTKDDDMAKAKNETAEAAVVAEAEKVIGSEAADETAKAATAEPEAEATPEAEAAPETAAEPDAAAKVLDVVKAMGGKVEALAAKLVPDLEKGMYEVSRFADVLSTISYLVYSGEYEAESEGDGSKVPAALRGWLKAGAAIFKDMAKEEVDELVAVGKVKKAAEAADLAKVATEAAGGKLAADAADALAKAEAAASALAKAASEHEAALAKVLAERDATLNAVAASLEPLAKRIAELEAMPMPSKTAGPGAVHAVSKEADAAGGAVEKTSGFNPADPVELAKAWGSLSEEERTLASITATRQFPMKVTFR